MRRTTALVAVAISSAWGSGCGSVSQKTTDAHSSTDAGAGADMAGPDAAGDATRELGMGMAEAGEGGPGDAGAGDTTAADTGTGDTRAGDTAGDTGAGDAGVLTATWTTTAQPLRSQSGAYFTFSCPAGGAPASIWGTDAYTDDSSLCTAAVHAGLVTLIGGGSVTIEIIPGLPAYAGTARNGITSQPFAAWTASFRFPAATTWTTSATIYRGLNTTLMRFICPSSGSTAQGIFGSDIYSDDSPVCVAAVHAGLITAASGGSVQIEIVPGQSSYAATTRNGITSLAYGAWPGSYIFPP